VVKNASKPRPPWIAWIDAGDLASIKQWLARGGDVEEEDPDTRNRPLDYAAWHGPIELVHLLLAYGADPRSVFLLAVATNHTDIARLLLPLTDDRDYLEQAAGDLELHGEDELLEELVAIRLKRLAKKKRKRR
jgi:ankyrin repeat protein